MRPYVRAFVISPADLECALQGSGDQVRSPEVSGRTFPGMQGEGMRPNVWIEALRFRICNVASTWEKYGERNRDIIVISQSPLDGPCPLCRPAGA